MRALRALFLAALGHPAARTDYDVDDPAERLRAHRALMQDKPLLREGTLHWYRELLPAVEATRDLPGDVIELGCGAGFLEELVPGLVKTDSVENPFAHRTLDAMAMDLPDASVRAFVAIGMLHHLPHPPRFFAEAARCLRLGGRLALVEPSRRYPVFGFPRVLFDLLDHYEHLDPSVEGWDNPGATNMRGANLALPWVIFGRDRARFEARFPTLRVRSVRYHTAIHHLLAGGFSLRSPVPRRAVPAVFAVERALTPFMDRLGAAMTVHLERV